MMLALKFVCWFVIVAIFLDKSIATNAVLFIGMIISLIAIFIAEKVAK
jgi:hypothetical protein